MASLFRGSLVNASVFLVLNLALAFYPVGAIWAIEIDIFRSWKLVGQTEFHTVQSAHWHKLPYWIFAPLGLALVGSIVLIWYHPEISPHWAIWGILTCQLLSHLLTAIYWGRWQAKLGTDERGPSSPYLTKILSTHWVRTLLFNAYGLILLAWTIVALT
jgi:hypothetical protein